jgi:hypothetical protein
MFILESRTTGKSFLFADDYATDNCDGRCHIIARKHIHSNWITEQHAGVQAYIGSLRWQAIWRHGTETWSTEGTNSRDGIVPLVVMSYCGAAKFGQYCTTRSWVDGASVPDPWHMFSLPKTTIALSKKFNVQIWSAFSISAPCWELLLTLRLYQCLQLNASFCWWCLNDIRFSREGKQTCSVMHFILTNTTWLCLPDSLKGCPCFVVRSWLMWSEASARGGDRLWRAAFCAWIFHVYTLLERGEDFCVATPCDSALGYGNNLTGIEKKARIFPWNPESSRFRWTLDVQFQCRFIANRYGIGW